MRILWFSITPANFNNSGNTCGSWIESLQRIVERWNNTELGICFVDNEHEIKQIQKGVTYYPINIKRNFFQKKLDQYTYKQIDPLILAKCTDVINDFCPNVIHIFGSEWCYGGLVNITKVPIIIHIQGCMPVYSSVGKSLRYSDMNKIRRKWYSPFFCFGYFLRKHKLNERVRREKQILKNNYNFFVRTRWDIAIVKFFNPDANLFFCNEALRNVFMYEQRKWHPKNRDKVVITTIGATYIKGVDLILKTAQLLKTNKDFKFEWRLIGGPKEILPVVCKTVRIKYSEVNVVPLGFLSADRIVDNLLDSDIYVHTSYIENSPNSICEAQYLGIPVIATYVGGIPSLFSSEYDQSMLVGVNDEYYLARKIIELSDDKHAQVLLSNENVKIAMARHSDLSISEDLKKAYLSVIEKNS